MLKFRVLRGLCPNIWVVVTFCSVLPKDEPHLHLDTVRTCERTSMRPWPAWQTCPPHWFTLNSLTFSQDVLDLCRCHTSTTHLRGSARDEKRKWTKTRPDTAMECLFPCVRVRLMRILTIDLMSCHNDDIMIIIIIIFAQERYRKSSQFNTWLMIYWPSQ